VLALVEVTKSRTPRTTEEQGHIDVLHSRIRKIEGCEGLLALRDSATGDALTIVLWRDRAAMDNGVKALSEDSDWAETAQRMQKTLGIEVVGELRTYEVAMNI
jgi:hypothetical protein